MHVKKTCRVCEEQNLATYIDLGFHPHSDRFLTTEQLNQEEVFYPLRVQICRDCGFHQLDCVLQPQVLYGEDYLYESSTTQTGKSHYFSMAEEICGLHGIPKGSLAVDIGSNVGVLLEGFKNNGMRVLGIDPARRIAGIANARGIKTECAIFSGELAGRLAGEYGKASVITGTNVFAHIDDLRDLARGIKTLLTEDGIFVFESPYLVDLIKNLEYDTIYHQHLSYLSIKPLVPFFHKQGLEIFDVHRSPIHGGSIRVFTGVKGKRPVKPVVSELIGVEESNGVYSLQALNNFSGAVKEQRIQLLSLLIELKKQKKKIVGVSAPAKGNTLLNYCGLHGGLLDYLTEKSQLKIGRYSPGTHIPIYPDGKLMEDNPDYALLLAWNFADEIIKNLSSFRKAGGKFIIPIPQPEIVS